MERLLLWTNEKRAALGDRPDGRRLWLDRSSFPPTKRGGSTRTVESRIVVGTLMYRLGTGYQWQALPKDRPQPGLGV